jgi:nicotinate-nucleotide adenylyltransferase
MNLTNQHSLVPECVIYGGTFDPPHLGHLGCVKNILNFFPTSSVLITPSPSPPISEGILKSPFTSFEHRFAMCELAFRNLGSKVQISQIERLLPAPHYTIQTVKFLSERFSRIGLLIGEDQFEKFVSWKEPKEILRLCDLVIQGRLAQGSKAQSDLDAEPRLLNIAHNIATSLGLICNVGKELKVIDLSDMTGTITSKIFLLPGFAGNQSSSSIREAISLGKEGISSEVPIDVLKYIKTNKLYLM